jgi:hypothetical protein
MAEGRLRDYTQADHRRRQGVVKGSGVGPVKNARDARQGYWDSPVVGILVTSLTLAFIAFVLLMIWLNL